VWPVLAFLVTRLVDAAFILIAQRDQIAVTTALESSNYHVHSASPAAPGYWEVATNFDGQWYEEIANDGYPAALPTNAEGEVTRNAWAFLPLFPATARAVMAVTGLDFKHAAVMLSLVCALFGTVLVYRLIADTAGATAARATVLLLCTSMAAATFQIAYTEGLALLLLSATLLQLRRQRYRAAAVLLMALGFTRPITLPLVVVILVHARSQHRADQDGLRRGPLAGLLIATALATVAWPALAALVTGRTAAYTETQRAWRAEDAGPFGVFSVAFDAGGWQALILCGALVALLSGVVLRPGTRSWGPELRAWSIAYPLYLLAVAPAAVSLFRFLLLAFPLAWIFPNADERSTRLQRLAIATCALAGLLAQWYWIRHFLVLGPVEEQFAMP
jgi:hypothetical protein